MAAKVATAPQAVFISLGIDAAWTVAESSGVALVRGVGSAVELLGVAPSYDSFIGLADAQSVSWHRPQGGTPDIEHLLDAVKRLGGRPADVVAVDMPLAVEAITGRREADRAVSRQFGAVGCSTHSPSPKRPGELGLRMVQEFNNAGYSLATTQADNHERCLLEVFPHVALFRMLNASYRVPYKVKKTTSYWKDLSKTERICRLIAEWKRIVVAMNMSVHGLHIPIPEPSQVTTLASLKPLEDALDAVVCALVGLSFATGNAEAFGNSTSAIWAPRAS